MENGNLLKFNNWVALAKLKGCEIILIFAPLKKFIAISLLAIYLLSLTELRQLVRLPALINHFNEHKSKDSSISLWKFLTIHYTTVELNDADSEKDMQLPFKSIDGSFNSVVLGFMPLSFIDLIKKPGHKDSSAYYFFAEKFLPAAYLASIWQPPKSC